MNLKITKALPTLKELLFAAALLNAFPVQAMTVTVAPASTGSSYQYIYAEGVIEDSGDDGPKLEQALGQVVGAGMLPVVMMDSRGGNVGVSMVMGRSLRSHRAVVYYKRCASACVFAMLGGVQRYRAPGGALIVHRDDLAEAYVKNPTPGAGMMMNMLREYIRQMTGSTALYDIVMTVPFSRPRALTEDEERSTNAVTGAAHAQ